MSSAENEADAKMDDKVWRMIVHRSNDNDCGVLDYFKLFFQLSQAFDSDPTIYKMLSY